MATVQQQNDPLQGHSLQDFDLSDPKTRDYLSQQFDMEDPQTKEYFDSFAAPAPVQAAGPSATPEGPVSVSAPDVPKAPAEPARNTESVIVNGFDKPTDEFLPKEVESEVIRMTNDPTVAPETIGAYLEQNGRRVDQSFYDNLAKTRKSIEETGTAAGSVEYQNADTMAADLLRENPGEPEAKPVSDPGWWDSAVRGYQDAVQYGAPGIVARTYYDWMGTGEDVLRKKFPNLNDDEIEALQEAVINQTQKKLRENNTIRSSNDPMIPWLAGQFFGSASPEDFIPVVRIGKGAKFADRLAKRMTEGAAIGTLGGVGWQIPDIASGVQDEFSATMAGAGTLMGAGFGGAMELGGSAARGILREDMSPAGRAAAAVRDMEPVSTPRGRKGSKVYKEDLTRNTATIQERVDRITEGWSNAPKVTVRERFTNLKGVDNDARGVFNRETGEVDLNMEVITQEAKRLDLPVEDIVNATLFHESLGHYGLLEEFGQGLDNKLAQIMDGADDNLRREVGKWMDENPDAYEGAPNRDLLALEEVLAEWSEKGPRAKSIYDTIANFVKETGRKMGLDVQFSEREVKALLAQAHGKVIDGKGSGVRGAGKRLKKLWHGSGADFNEFDHSYMGTGEGNQVFGWGTYLTESRGIGEGYRRAIGGEDVLWGGVDMPWYQMRDAMDQEIRGKYGNQMAVDVANAVFDHIRDSRRPPTPLTIAGAMGLKPRSEQQVKDVYDAMSPIIKDVENRIQRRVRGKLYEVEVADDLDWNLWNSDLSSQPKMKKALEDQGYKFVSEDEYRANQDAFAEARMDYEDATGQYNLLESDTSGVSEQMLDDAFLKVQETAQKFQEAKRANENVVYDGLTGEDAYALLADKLGSDKAASLYLDEKGIAGNQYEAGTVAGTTPKNPDGSPVYNYVVFNDQTPKITARYSKPKKGDYLPVGEQAQNDNILPYNKTRKGRPQLPGRSMSDLEYAQFADDTAAYYKNEAAKWINRNESLYNKKLASARKYEQIARDSREKAMRNRNGTIEARSVRPSTRETVIDTQTSEAPAPGNDRYSKPKKFNDPRDVKRVPKTKRLGDVDKSEPIDISQLDAEALMEMQNADDLLKDMVKDHVPETMTMDDIKYEAELRGFTYSDLMKRKGIDTGTLSERMMMYDIAMGKLNDKLSGLYAKLQDGTATATNRSEYLKTVYRMQELGSRIFGEHSELGRALRTIQELDYTLRNVKGLQNLTGSANPSGLEKLLADPEQFLRFAREVQGEVDEAAARSARKAPSKLATAVAETINFPRAIMSSMDLSAPMRQGAFLMHKPEWWKAMLSMFKYAMSEESYAGLMRDITSRPTYKDMVKANVPFTKREGRLSQREEDFMSTWAGKIPVVGSLVKGSERAYAGFLNKLRADTFDSMVTNYQRQGIDFTSDPATLKQLGGFIGNATGRGSLGETFDSATPWLSGLFFSPRLIASRVQMLNPMYYARLPKGVREQAVMSLLATGANATTAVSLLAMSGLAPDVEIDPRSSDFGKVKIGDTRYDVLGGLPSYITLGSRLTAFGADTAYKSATGDRLIEHYKTSTGDLRRYGNKPTETSALEAVGSFATNKSSPVASLVVDFLRQQDFKGDPVNLTDAVVSRTLPIMVQDIYEAGQKYGYLEGTARMAPAVFGVSASDYMSKALDPNQPQVAPEIYKDSDLPDMTNEYVEVTDGEVFLRGPAREIWQGYLDKYLQEDMQALTSDPMWPSLSDEEKADLIADVRNKVKEDAKADTLYDIGLD